MESVNGRIIVLRKYLGLNQTKFAKEIGVTSQFISALEKGKSRFTDANIRLVCLTFKVNEEWLRDGTGEMIDDEAELSDYDRRLLAVFRQLTPQARKMLIEYAEKLHSDEKALRGEAEKGEESEPAQGTTSKTG